MVGNQHWLVAACLASDFAALTWLKSILFTGNDGVEMKKRYYSNAGDGAATRKSESKLVVRMLLYCVVQSLQ